MLEIVLLAPFQAVRGKFHNIIRHIALLIIDFRGKNWKIIHTKINVYYIGMEIVTCFRANRSMLYSSQSK